MSLQKNTLESLLSEKKEILKLFVIATALAFSVGVLASLTAAQSTIPSWVICVIASVGTLVSLVALALDLKSGLKFEERLDAALVIDTPTNRILKIKGYRFSEDVAEALSAIEIENKSIFFGVGKRPIST